MFASPRIAMFGDLWCHLKSTLLSTFPPLAMASSDSVHPFHFPHIPVCPPVAIPFILLSCCC